MIRFNFVIVGRNEVQKVSCSLVTVSVNAFDSAFQLLGYDGTSPF